ncbi:toxin-activating lysine-acyltransferase [Bradyrhizobium sp. HKCCYLS2038]|uniref:toxin-activating lysine-acyltransferase n=1 Tax=unclassified Bradyrhizobium TaxID=2631580 RepID=UPI003EBAF7A0
MSNDTPKDKVEGAPMGEAGTATGGPQAVLGEEALKAAIDALGAGHATPGAAQQPGAPVKTVSQVMGEISWLMTQSPRHKSIPIGDLEWLVMPAVILKQFRLYYNGERPVGVALWALVDDVVAHRIDTGDRRLAAAEWKSGSHLRVIDIVAPFGGEAEMRKHLEVGG